MINEKTLDVEDVFKEQGLNVKNVLIGSAFFISGALVAIATLVAMPYTNYDQQLKIDQQNSFIKLSACDALHKAKAHK